MADDRVKQTEKKRSGFAQFLIAMPFRVLMIIIVSILISITIEWLGIYFSWWELPGADHAENVMRVEMGWLDENFSKSLMVSSPVTFATDVLSASNDVLFVRTGIAAWALNHAESVGWVATIKTYVAAAIFVTLMTLTRCLILILTLPLFVMAAIVGGTDGLVMRDLRRFGAGRESAFIYHHAKRAIGPVFVTGWLIYLSLPFSVHPNLFLLPCAAVFGLSIAIAASSFKKYL